VHTTEAETGIVVETRGDTAIVQVEPRAQCAHCAARLPCYSMGPGVRRIHVENTVHARVGDRVQIDCPPQSRVLSAFLLFFFPIVLALVGYFVGFAVRPTEGSGVLGTFVGFILAFAIVWLLNPLLKRRQRRPTLRGMER
jgi:positive regulator of sigma E activity